MRIIVLHGSYGCDSGCCGHWVEIDGEQQGRFRFEHPFGEDEKEFIKKLVTEHVGIGHVKDIDWDNCRISDDN